MNSIIFFIGSIAGTLSHPEVLICAFILAAAWIKIINIRYFIIIAVIIFITLSTITYISLVDFLPKIGVENPEYVALFNALKNSFVAVTLGILIGIASKRLFKMKAI